MFSIQGNRKRNLRGRITCHLDYSCLKGSLKIVHSSYFEYIIGSVWCVFKQQFLFLLEIHVNEKMYENTYNMLFKNWKHIFKIVYQIGPLLFVSFDSFPFFFHRGCPSILEKYNVFVTLDIISGQMSLSYSMCL